MHAQGSVSKGAAVAFLFSARFQEGPGWPLLQKRHGPLARRLARLAPSSQRLGGYQRLQTAPPMRSKQTRARGGAPAFSRFVINTMRRRRAVSARAGCLEGHQHGLSYCRHHRSVLRLQKVNITPRRVTWLMLEGTDGWRQIYLRQEPLDEQHPPAFALAGFAGFSAAAAGMGACWTSLAARASLLLRKAMRAR